MSDFKNIKKYVKMFSIAPEQFIDDFSSSTKMIRFKLNLSLILIRLPNGYNVGNQDS